MCVQWWEKFECGCTSFVGNVESCSSGNHGNQGYLGSQGSGNQGSGNQCPKNPGVEMRKKYTLRPGKYENLS
ncbi:predicted protein [Uncinocarpus reesii 1704]|uniref:Uncharacterized protein n=1 Tax=Uncinocarpus reesii (strain UAMH 1704) TaxID=336963 RepID=C4JY60_UNCRE|nr:uncharacterized protein UREG_07111 [Uncinocarpus reesii 1704]EEP82246.1 predicted protein [Uncinocarpus reesii 1704]